LTVILLSDGRELSGGTETAFEKRWAGRFTQGTVCAIPGYVSEK
jgi:hypothetical protein